MAVSRFAFGTTKAGQAVTAGRLTNAAGMSVTVLDYGATIQALAVPDGSGNVIDVALGYDTLAEYEASNGHLGATIGRVGNRIGGARFSLNGREYTLAKNDGENHLHGGLLGFDKRIWTMDAAGEDALRFSRLSPDGEEGYPGNLQVSVTFTLTQDNALRIAYDAVCDQDTPVNLTNHTYFNLNGGGSVLDHTLQVFAERFCENGDGCLPTGRLLDVADTPFDFRTPKTIGRDIDADCQQLRRGGGYDHNYVLSGRRAAVLAGARILMETETDLPGMQVYTANGLSSRPGKGGSTMGPRGAVCLETQLFPNGMNCWGFPSPILRAGQPLHTETVYRFRQKSDIFHSHIAFSA